MLFVISFPFVCHANVAKHTRTHTHKHTCTHVAHTFIGIISHCIAGSRLLDYSITHAKCNFNKFCHAFRPQPKSQLLSAPVCLPPSPFPSPTFLPAIYVIATETDTHTHWGPHTHMWPAWFAALGCCMHNSYAAYDSRAALCCQLAVATTTTTAAAVSKYQHISLHPSPSPTPSASVSAATSAASSRPQRTHKQVGIADDRCPPLPLYSLFCLYCYIHINQTDFIMSRN